jgi:RHS repeat-associated protein
LPSNSAFDREVTFNLRFPGQVFDGQAGLHQNYFRDYDPATGRYVESDPMGLAAGIDPYLYAAANPVWSFDSYGLASCSYSVAAHSLSCTPNAGGQPLLLGPNGVFSGVGKCRNQNSCSGINDLGPIPTGDYNMNRDDRQGHEGFWRLEPNPHSPGWKCRLGISRCGFELHPGGISLGCITADKNNSAVMDQYKLINNLLIREDGSNGLKVVP